MVKGMEVRSLPEPIAVGPDRLDPDRFSARNRRRLSGPGLRTFLAIADLWGLDEEERRLILGYPARSTYHAWAKAAREHRGLTLDVDTLTRISAMLGIHQALGVLEESEQAAVAWLRSPNRARVFGGQPPLRLVANGTQDGLMTVRRHLDAARGGLHMEPNDIDSDARPYDDADIVFR